MSGGEWIQADPIPGTILVNLGDLMQFWTSDRYLATVTKLQINFKLHFMINSSADLCAGSSGASAGRGTPSP